MPQNLVSLDISADEIAAMDQAIATLEALTKPFITLSADDKNGLVKMGDKSEAFCRQTLIVLDQNRQILPPTFDLAEAVQDLATLDLLRLPFNRLRQLMGKADDTEMALGRDVMSAALDGYALAKVFGKGAGLETLREAMSARYSRKPKTPADVPA